jgi:hypothetical protein
MIFALVTAWVLFSIAFFASIAVAASRPLPQIDVDELVSDPVLRQYEMDANHEESFVGAVAHPELETAHS